MTARRKIGVAIGLWLVLVFLVWNVVFDRVLVLAARRYVYDAAMAADQHRPPILLNSVMPQAIDRGIRLASLAAGGVVLVGLVAVLVAVRVDARRGLRDGVGHRNGL